MTIDDSSDRDDLFDRTLEDLTDDAETRQNTLIRGQVDALYLRRNLTPEQTVALERALKAAGIRIAEDKEQSTNLQSDTDGVPHSGALNHLLALARQYPFLDADSEAACGEAVQRSLEIRSRKNGELDDVERRVVAAGDKAHATLVTSNIRLVAKVAFEPRFRGGVDLDDLVQLGLIGLMRAAEKFDPDWETRFSTYAVWWIRQGISRGIADQGRTIRLPVHVIDRVSRFNKTRRSLGLGSNYATGHISRIADSLGWTDAYTARIAQIAEMRIVPLDAPVADDRQTPLVDLVEDSSPTPEQETVRSDTALRVRALVAELEDARLRDIVSSRFGLLSDAETLEQIGDRYGVTRERIRQLEEKALRMLSKRAKKRKLTDHTKVWE